MIGETIGTASQLTGGFAPFGPRQGPAPAQTLSNYGYTGHSADYDLMLINMRGRVYDTVQRRFLTRDPVLDNPYAVGGTGPYTYVRNNPPNLTDPTGFMGEDRGGDQQMTPQEISDNIGNYTSQGMDLYMANSGPSSQASVGQGSMNDPVSGIGASMEQGRMAQSMSLAPGGFSGPTSMADSGDRYGGNSPSQGTDARSGMGPLAGPSPGSQPRGGDNPSFLDRALDWLFPPLPPGINIGVIWVPGMPIGAPAARGLAPNAITQNANVTEKGLGHVLARHVAGGAKTAGKSL